MEFWFQWRRLMTSNRVICARCELRALRYSSVHFLCRICYLISHISNAFRASFSFLTASFIFFSPKAPVFPTLLGFETAGFSMFSDILVSSFQLSLVRKSTIVVWYRLVLFEPSQNVLKSTLLEMESQFVLVLLSWQNSLWQQLNTLFVIYVEYVPSNEISAFYVTTEHHKCLENCLELSVMKQLVGNMALGVL